MRKSKYVEHMVSLARKTVEKLWFTFYSWGGDDPNGFDCSGMVIEILKSVGILPRRYDATAQMLIELFGKYEVPSAYEGCLVGYYDDSETRIVHIEYCINETMTIGASGGYSKTKTREDAIKHNAFIKMRPINHERGRVIYVDPFKILTGEI